MLVTAVGFSYIYRCYRHEFPHMEQTSNLIKRAFSYAPQSLETVAQVGTFWPDMSLRRRPLLDSLIAVFSHTEACMVLSNTVKARQWRERKLGLSGQSVLISTAKVCCVLNNRDFPSSYGGWPLGVCCLKSLWAPSCHPITCREMTHHGPLQQYLSLDSLFYLYFQWSYKPVAFTYH